MGVGGEFVSVKQGEIQCICQLPLYSCSYLLLEMRNDSRDKVLIFMKVACECI